ncbi:acyltransferase [Klebsiella pneumoniae]|uniref:acyltransferase family protein n=1 Tax=Klebsiella pneumoniae TaxID=573 RepID=UPI000E2B1050|nr:acyltransferase [Klebsiella pneumoniae]ELB6486143.1 acyltransferase [Raoultella ornithinolytica]SXN77360.1 acyltransferase [Klebsiella pneumoniae]HBR2706240.1 acyltransferase [Klebsiella pneumoniae]HBW0304346.1 acyltransferase [Klebsiella pneumoniae]HBW0834430.1 acyltransferase [Klebsiella pneumoniae]
MYIFSSVLALVAALIIMNTLGFHKGVYNKSGVVSITGARCFLCLLVLISHANKILYSINNEWLFDKGYKLPFGVNNFYINSGKVGVLVFFMISGYLFYRVVYRENVSLFGVLMNRIKRIIPMYWFSLLLIMACCFVFFNPVFSMEGIIDIVSWALFWGGNSIAGTDSSLVNSGVEWTLRVEWMLYVSIIIISLLTNGMSNKNKDIVVVVSIGGLLIVSAAIRLYSDFYIDPRPVIGFFTGFIAYRMQSEIKAMKYKRTFSLAAMVSLLLSLVVSSHSFYYIIPFFLCSVFFIVISSGNDIFGILSNKTVVSIGEVSYSIYLIHGIVLFIMDKIINAEYLSDFYALFIFNVSLMLISCYVSKFTYLFIEKKWFKQFSAAAA